MGNDPILGFNPNGAETPVYAFWNGSKLEAKERRGGLVTKLGNARQGSLWKLTPGGWEQIALKHPSVHNDTCTLCHRAGVHHQWAAQRVKQASRYNRYTHIDEVSRDTTARDAWCFERKGRKLVDPLKLHFLCPECQEATGWY